MLGALRAAAVDASNEAQATALVRYLWRGSSLASFDIGLRFRSLNFLDSVVRTSRRARIHLRGEAKERQTCLAMNLLLLLALAVPLSCLAFLSLLALLGVMTLGAVIHVPGTVRARWPQWRGVEQANNPAG